MRILTLNCGSSTLKFDVLAPAVRDTEVVRTAHGSVERIGHRGAASITRGEKALQRDVETHGYEAAFSVAMDLLKEMDALSGVEAVGHRVVHGGPRFRDTALIDEGVIEAIREVSELAPLHNGPALEVIEAARQAFGEAMPMVAAFDTAFFTDLPEVSARYALPREVSDRYGIRRFGFHGLAHGCMVRRFVELRPDVPAPRVITLQLGSGCSAAASWDGRPIDTSMGYTPLEGLVMGTRTGDIDPAVPLRLQSLAGMSAGEVEELLNRQSGLLGLSGRSGEMRDLVPAAAKGDRDSEFAVEAFCVRVRKYVGAYMALLGGLDGLVFGGGIGENMPEIRRRVCTGMEWAGMMLDGAANEEASGPESRISTADSNMDIWVMRVDEAAVIARETYELLTRNGGQHAADG